MSCCCNPNGPAPTPPASELAYGALQCSEGEAIIFANSGAADTLLAITGTAFVFDGSGHWSLTPSGGVLTYTGPAIIVHARATISMASVDDLNAAAGFLVISQNGEFIGESPFSGPQILAGFSAQRHDVANANGNRVFNMSSERQITLASGDTLQVVGGNGVAHDLGINSVSLLLLQVALASP